MEVIFAVVGCFGGKYVHLRLGDLDGTVEGCMVFEVDCLLLIVTAGVMGKVVGLEVGGFGDDGGDDGGDDWTVVQYMVLQVVEGE